MHSIKLRSHIGDDRLLQIQLPEGIENIELDIVLVYQPVNVIKPETLNAVNVTSKSIWQLSEDFVKDVSIEEISLLPRDGAEQHDHYIYGVPKQKA